MSHDDITDPTYAGPVPSERRQPTWPAAGSPPPKLPSEYLNPMVGDPPDLPTQPDDDGDGDDLVVSAHRSRVAP